MRTEQEVRVAIDKHSDTVKRIGITYLKNYADMEDVFQKVFMKYVLFENDFQSTEHEKAWFIRVTINECKDFLKSFFKAKTIYLEDDSSIQVAEVEEINPLYSEILQAITSMPQKYKSVIYLHYYEGYTAFEIANLLKKNENTIYTWLSRGRKILEKKLGGTDDE